MISNLPRLTVILFLVTASLPLRAADKVLVLTALPVTYSISKTLADGTSINVENVPESGRPMNSLENFFSTRAANYADLFKRADAVVTIGKLWHSDPLFTAARAENIRVIDIDATAPWSTTLSGISVAPVPVEDVSWADRAAGERELSVYFWLSLANGARMADIVARDLSRLSPDDADLIAANLAAFRKNLLDLKHEYEVKLATLTDVTVFALAPEYIYLATDMGLFVDGNFFKQDIDWTAADLENFRNYLEANSIRVVLHKWVPDEKILAALTAAGARLVVLDLLDGGSNGETMDQDAYLNRIRGNLENLYQALALNSGSR